MTIRRHLTVFSVSILFGLSGTSFAQIQYDTSEVLTELDCEAAFGMMSSIDGVQTCTLPVINELDFETEEGVANCNQGEPISSGSFCRVAIDQSNADQTPDCVEVNLAKAGSSEGYDQWLIDVEQPYSDAWKCARLE